MRSLSSPASSFPSFQPARHRIALVPGYCPGTQTEGTPMERSHSTVRSRRARHATATLASLVALGAEAQDAPAGGGLAEVVVTARLREESMQRVPEAISAVSSQQIEQMFQVTTQAVEGFAPNLVFDRITAGPAAASISIRGLSFQDIEKSF